MADKGKTGKKKNTPKDSIDSFFDKSAVGDGDEDDPDEVAEVSEPIVNGDGDAESADFF